MIYVFVPDADGCLYHRSYRYSLVKDVIAYNKVLLDFVREQAKDCSQFIILNGSNRQSKAIDDENKQKNKTGSFLVDLDYISKYLGANLNKLLLADIFSKRSGGEFFNRAINPDDSGHHRSFYIDDTKVLLLYAQMHNVANDNPSEEIIFDFYDDRGLAVIQEEDILSYLDVFFTSYPELIPNNVILRLNHYGDNQQITHINQIVGCGIIDVTYRKTVIRMYQITMEKETPLKNRIHSALYISPDELSCRRQLNSNDEYYSFSQGRSGSVDLESKSADMITIDLYRPLLNDALNQDVLVGSDARNRDMVSVDLLDIASTKNPARCCFGLFSCFNRTPVVEQHQSKRSAQDVNFEPHSPISDPTLVVSKGDNVSKNPTMN